MPRKRRIKRGYKLRDYQRDAVYKIKNHFRDCKSTLLAMSVGCGKTHVFLAWIAETVGSNDRALIIAHRRELIYQPAERIKQFFPSLHPAGIVMAESNDVDARVIIATVQTLVSGNRLNEILAHGPITHLVTDEAHHSIADTYELVYKRLFEANPDMKHLGATATPKRSDDIALKSVFESVAYRLPLNKAIKMGALVPFVAQGFYVERVSLGHLDQSGEDWSSNAVGEVMTERAVLDTAVEKWLEHAKGRPTIAFCATVEQARRMALWFERAGVPAATANYKTPKSERAAILARFQVGQVKVLTNAMLFTEGVDLPLVEVALMLRPTRSDSLYVQMAGRVLRTWPGKESALIIDLIPADARNMVMGGDLLGGKPKAQRKAEENAEKKDVVLPCFGIDSQGQGIDGPPDKVFMRVLDYLTSSSLAWTNADGMSSVGLSDRVTLAVVHPPADRIAKAEALRESGEWNDAYQRRLDEINVYRLFTLEKYQSGRFKRTQVKALGAFPSWDEVSIEAEDFASRNADATLARRKKQWRRKEPTEGQVKFAHSLGVDPAGMMRGQVAQAITHTLAMKYLKRERLLWT